MRASPVIDNLTAAIGIFFFIPKGYSFICHYLFQDIDTFFYGKTNNVISGYHKLNFNIGLISKIDPIFDKIDDELHLYKSKTYIFPSDNIS